MSVRKYFDANNKLKKVMYLISQGNKYKYKYEDQRYKLID